MLWFRNLQIYRLNPDHGMSADSIRASLEKKPFVPCGSMDMNSAGWIAPAKHRPDDLIYTQQDAVLVQLKTETKLLPAIVIRQEADERIRHIEEEEARKVGRKETKEIRERVAEELLPRAFAKQGVQRAIIDLQSNLVLVESASASRAENLLSDLRDALGSLPTRLLQTSTTPQTAMTVWLEQGAPDAFTLDADCELRFPGDDGAVARFSRQDLNADEVRKHLESGKLVTKMGLSWDERISFQLTEKLELKRLAMLDVLQDDLKNADADSQDALFESSFALTVGELRQFVPAIIAALGGELPA
ncbi:recombination-associated protein RdgC [Chitinilyticum litopenaei]|uniref:recombination-associated protein RdgC n=1 Tax=Chitinilyticum litopenaei TaxID=1121276 RepID=UPI0004020B71|nr:recombination-associated protein RdgC [Chitinilyticum litopenaei]